MQNAPDPMEEYAAAVAAERIAWDAVRCRLPGSRDYDRELWSRWRNAVNLADEAAARAKNSAAPLSTRPLAAGLLGKPRPDPVQLPPISIGLRRSSRGQS